LVNNEKSPRRPSLTDRRLIARCADDYKLVLATGSPCP
jgi:hypothetical protein